MHSKQQVALLLVNMEALVPTEVSREAALEVGKLEPHKFDVGWSAKKQRRNPQQRKALRNYYRHFKEDLTLNKKQLRGPDDGAWKMKTRRTDADKPRGNLGELIQQDPRAYFSALQAAEVFLYHIVREAAIRVRKLFDDGVPIHIHFTAPAFQDKDKDSSARYRGYLREITERLSEQSLFKDITFKTGGDDFLYEPYGVWYYFATVEQAIARRSEAAGKTFLVFDMGGSTTDLALVQVNRQAGSFKLYPLCSSIECAGEYFDRFVLKTLLNVERLPTQSQRWSETLEEIEAAKIALCTGQANEATIEIDGERHVLTRARLEEILNDLWSDVNRPLGPGFRGFLQQALKEAQDNPQFLEFDRIERVFLAGGSTELPGIQTLIYEDLQRLALVNGKDHLFVVPHRTIRKGGGIVPRSCLAALGQAGEMAEVAGASDEQKDTFVLDRAEYLFAHVKDDQKTTYTFPRRHVKRSGPVPQDETFLFDVSEVRGQNRARFDETDGGVPVFEPYDGVTELPKRFDFHFRNNLEKDYPHDPHITLITKAGLSKTDAGQGDGAGRTEHLLRFSCDAQHFEGELKVKPYLRRSDGRIWQRVHQDAGSVRVSLRPPSVVSENPERPDEPVHVCIDLGMNNTALAIYAPGRVFPEGAEEIEVFTLGERAEPDKGESGEQDPEPSEEPKDKAPVDDQPEDAEDMKEQISETNGTPPDPIVPTSGSDHLTWVSEMIRWVDSVTQRREAGGNDEQASQVINQLRDVAGSLRDTTEQLKRIADQRESGKFINPDEAIADLIEAGASPVTQPANEDLSYEAFRAFIESHKEGIIFDEKILRQIWARCMGDEGQLVVLAGPPGSGKTTLVRLLAEFFNRGIDANAFPPGWEAFYLLQPVSPSWFSPANLLGSVSPLDGQFRETAFLRFLLKAEAHHYYVAEGDASRRFFACLDEFNIAQPEQYLADLLSKLEAPPGSEARKLTLCEGRDIGRDEPWTLELTPNVKLFATLNTDVSTKTLSPKVLDRCFFLRLTPTFDDLEVAALRFVEHHKKKGQDLTSFHEYFRSLLESVDTLGRKANTPVGFRSIKQAYDYVAKHPLASDLSAEGVLSQLADEVLCSFFLSKLPGAYAVNNPEYEKALSNDKSLLRKHPGATRILDRIGEGFPGQAVL